MRPKSLALGAIAYRSEAHRIGVGAVQGIGGLPRFFADAADADDLAIAHRLGHGLGGGIQRRHGGGHRPGWNLQVKRQPRSPTKQRIGLRPQQSIQQLHRGRFWRQQVMAPHRTAVDQQTIQLKEAKIERPEPLHRWPRHRLPELFHPIWADLLQQRGGLWVTAQSIQIETLLLPPAQANLRLQFPPQRLTHPLHQGFALGVGADQIAQNIQSDSTE
jgi:hypothetical protein